ncbi:MAG: hypothetical protein U0263_38235 [Polyangiaceae bacterium]
MRGPSFPSSLGLTAVVCLALSAVTPARAQPSAEDIKAAGAEFDLGKQSYKKKAWVEAAEHFESADARAPSAVALELAIRARDKAGQLDRAATLAELGLERHPNDAAVAKAADPVLKKARAELHALRIRCTPACELVLGTKLVHGAAAATRTVYVTPGTVSVNASFGPGRTRSKDVEASKGGSSDVAFEAPPEAAKTEPPPTAVEPGPTSPRPNSVEPAVVPATHDQGPKPEPSGGLPPGVFFVGVGLTVVAGGVTVWSGIDTQNNPGKDKVRTECAGQGTDCPAYQDGLSRQNRTNVLLGVSAGLAVVTGVVGAFFTDWSGGAKKEARIAPFVTVGHGAAVGATGRF